MTSERFFHFTIGPVQDFVAQARRTRDFWAGSFLLSTLSAVAMREVEAQGGRVLFPIPDPNFMKALAGESVDHRPKQGVVPNRFKAEIPEAFDPQTVGHVVRLAWLGIARLAWYCIPADLRNNHQGLRRVWSRQIGVDFDSGTPHTTDPFWQVSWAIGSAEDGEDLLDRRKNLRVHRNPSEPGVKCMLMDGWQELSGAPRPGTEMTELWQRLHKRINLRNKSDLRDDEQLCALSLVKRLFPDDFEKLEVSMPSGWTLHGWRLDTGVPSGAYLSAAPWLARVIHSIEATEADDFYEVAMKAGNNGERRTRLKLVRDVADSYKDARAKLADLDGDLFFDSSLANTLDFPLTALSCPVRKKLARIRQLPDRTSAGSANVLGEPDRYFAIVAMDGDNLGRNMADRDKQEAISAALADFTSRVPTLVSERSGFLVYAGGDDVIALFPVPEAIPCARALRSWYEECFHSRNISSTLSAGILFANHKLPLTHVLRDAHRLLDDVAKEGRGRDAIAVQVTSRGGELIRWAQPWKIALAGGNVLALERLASEMAKEEAPFSHSFFHRIDTLLRLVNPDRRRRTAPLDDPTAVDLFTAELLDSGRYRGDPSTGLENERHKAGSTSRVEKARSHVEALLDQCRPRQRRLEELASSTASGATVFEPHERIEADGAFLVRFLSRRQWKAFS